MANIRPISKELQQKAIDELNEDDSRIPDDIQAIREWLQQKKYINARTDDQSILTFLRGCKFSLERTKEKIEAFYSMRTLLPELLRNRDPFQPEIQEILKLGQFLPVVNQNDPTAPRIIIVNLASFDPEKVCKQNLMKVQIMIEDILLQEDDQMNICGMQLIIEFEGLKMAHVMPVPLMMNGLSYLQDCVPIRTKAMHLFNMPSFFESVLNMAKTFMNEKLRGRLQVHNMKTLQEFGKIIPKEDLPKEYGGDGLTLQELTDFWKKKVESYAEWFREDEKYGTDEKLRPGKPKTSQETFGVEGVEGSFRKLNVD